MRHSMNPNPWRCGYPIHPLATFRKFDTLLPQGLIMSRSGMKALREVRQERTTLICGFPRSGNTALRDALKCISHAPKLTSHAHEISLIYSAAKLNTRVIVPIRHPLNSVSSLHVWLRTNYSLAFSASRLLRLYTSYHRELITLSTTADKILFVDYDVLVEKADVVVRGLVEWLDLRPNASGAEADIERAKAVIGRGSTGHSDAFAKTQLYRSVESDRCYRAAERSYVQLMAIREHALM